MNPSFAFSLCEKPTNIAYLLNSMIYRHIEQQATLEDIVYQCPLSGGIAVYQARSLYALTHPEVGYTDATYCTQSGLGWRNGQPTVPSDLTIYPNPADDIFQIVTTSKTEQVLKVYDIWGREVFSTHFNLTFTVPTEKWAAGVYTCKAAGVDGSKPTSHKIIVIH